MQLAKGCAIKISERCNLSSTSAGGVFQRDFHINREARQFRLRARALGAAMSFLSPQVLKCVARAELVLCILSHIPLPAKPPY